MDPRTQKLLEQARRAGDDLPPVEQWQPELCGDIDIRISANGDWYHEGSKFTRPSLVALFAKVLRKEGNDYFLVTPVEKLRIQVEDAPLLVIDADILDVDGQSAVTLTTATGDHFLLDKHHPLWVCTRQGGEPRPYVHVRNGLQALISRAVFYRLIEASMARGFRRKHCLFIYSQGQPFLLGVYDEAS